MKDRPVTSLTEEEKTTALKVIGRELDKLERAHGVSIVRWVVNRRHDQRAERRRLREEKAKLEERLAQIDRA